MKRLLLLGGMTPDVTVLYYNTINRTARDALGARHGAPLHLHSADLEHMLRLAGAGDWDGLAREYIDNAVLPLASAGVVDGVVVCAILAHKAARQLEASLLRLQWPLGGGGGGSIPLLHIADFVGRHLRARHPGVRTVGLLGPAVTMSGADDPDFFVGRLQNAENGLRVLVPEKAGDLAEVNRGVLEEVARGAAAVTAETKAMFLRHARGLVERGAEAIILGSTDLGFVIRQSDLPEGVIVIEPAAIHAEAVARWALE